jgi:hypothetical protein
MPIGPVRSTGASTREHELKEYARIVLDGQRGVPGEGEEVQTCQHHHIVRRDTGLQLEVRREDNFFVTVCAESGSICGATVLTSRVMNFVQPSPGAGAVSSRNPRGFRRLC